MSYNGVTMLQDLPTIDEYNLPPPGMSPGFERPQQHQPMAFSKFIKPAGHTGMGEYSGMGSGSPSHSIPNFNGYTGTGAEMSGPGGYLQMPSQGGGYDEPEMYSSPPVTEHYDFGESSGVATSADAPEEKECSCRDVYDHVNGCNICKAFYMEGRSNFIYLLIIAIQIIIIGILASKCYTIHSR